MRFVSSVLVALFVLAPGPALALMLVPPVDAVAVRRFEAPATTWGPGHRGVDYDVPVGTLVRAAAAGTVAFAGPVGNVRAVAIAHGGGLETTYSSLSEINVAMGQIVGEGTWLGRSGAAHPGRHGLHFGVKLHGDYVDPAGYFSRVVVTDAIRLAPLVWQPPRQMPEAFRSAFRDPGTEERLCRDGVPLPGETPVAPNENVAVAIAGIGSSTEGGMSADMYKHGPEELGYPAERIFPFSYRGSEGPRLHTPYRSRDTFGDIDAAAEELADLLAKVGRSNPGRSVDLIAHSMGGLVARRFLASIADRHGERLPHVEHLVTFSAPHQGAALATVGENLEDRTLTGGLLVDGVSAWAARGGPVPDPRSTAIAQMHPGSGFLEDLARESVSYGTRVLALAIPNDLVVTADRAAWEEASTRVVPPAGLNGHSGIVASDVAQGLAHAFLRDAAPSCEGRWDLWGPRVGTAIGFAEEQSYRGLVAVEQAYLGRALKLGRLAQRIGGRAGWAAKKVAGNLVHRAAVKGLGP